MNDIILRSFIEADLPAILAIEESSFSSPWTRTAFLYELQNPHSRLTVAEREGEVVGYICCWDVADEVQILNVAVHPHFRRQGIADLLLRSALEDGQRSGVQSANLEVRGSNLPAIQLYKKLGFRQVGMRRGYYADGEDALLMILVFSP